jgi:SAM-dependent methyltransferase
VRVVVGNVDDTTLWDLVDDESFDVITFGDVLEHLQDPLAVLRVAKHKLKQSGFIVTSLPNVAHGDVRLSLLHGSFPYRETGLLDRTHIRFFTLQTIRELLYDAGLVVVDTKRVVMPLFQTELGLTREDYPEAVLDEIRADPESETYQYVMKAVLDDGSQGVVAMAHRVDELSDRVLELELRNRALLDQLVDFSKYEAHYEALQEEHARVGEEMQAWITHAEDLKGQVGQLREALQGMTARADELGATAHTLNAALTASEQKYEEITSSRSYRLLAPLRRLRRTLRDW